MSIKKYMMVPILMLSLALTGCTASVVQDTAKKVVHTETLAKHLNSNRTFTLAQLSHYNGKNGQPAYIAVNGKVYDVTHAPDWKNGQHHGILSGQDLTQAIVQSPHGTSVLSAVPIVGQLVQTKTAKATPSGQKTTKQTATSSGSSSSNSSGSSATQGSSSSQQSGRAFTLSELKKYNGQNGQPAYVAISGKVYDVTHANGWHNGFHHGIEAGQDLTQAIQNSPHGTSVLAGVSIIGYLK